MKKNRGEREYIAKAGVRIRSVGAKLRKKQKTTTTSNCFKLPLRVPCAVTAGNLCNCVLGVECRELQPPVFGKKIWDGKTPGGFPLEWVFEKSTLW